MFANEIIEFAFGFFYVFKRSESLDMRFPDIGNQSEIGLGYGTQLRNFAGMACPHFHNAYLVLVLHRQKRERHPDVIIEISLRKSHLELFRKNGRNQFLGSGFAIGACDADDGNFELAPMMIGKLLQGFEDIVHHDDAMVAFESFVALVNYGVSATLLQGAQGIMIAIEFVAFECKKYRARRTVARIGCDDRILNVDIV
ncbi:MAG: hypothetical protein BWZ06_01309 [Bacteroidetes bacterium ADurb.BinA261]|nr:MAG: hypothetical protein BWZ06_01309 [Bacteroidetes bacterium ADurb.BinA261]